MGSKKTTGRIRCGDVSRSKVMNLTTMPIYMRTVRDRSQNESLNGSHISSRKLGPAKRVSLDICSVQPAFRIHTTTTATTTTRGFHPRSCVSPTDVRTVSRVRARETESYREWRVPGEISKFPFNGIIKRSGEGDAQGLVTTWHSVNSQESLGVERKVSQ